MAIVAWLLVPAAGRAQPEAQPPLQGASSATTTGLQVHWTGPADCDRGATVRAKVLRLLGNSVRAADGLEVAVTVTRKAASRYVAELETRAASGLGRKRLEGESCAAIALASSVIIALSIDPEAALEDEPEPESKPAAVSPPDPAPASKLERSPSPSPPSLRRELTGYAHGSIGVLLRLLGEPSAFVDIGVGARYRRFGIELGAALYQERQVAHAERPAQGAELRLFSGELLGCYAFVPFPLGVLEACAGARLEYLSATAFGVSNPDEGRLLLLAGLAALRGRLRATSWLSATLDVGLAARPFHPTLVLVGVGEVFEIPVLSPWARTGLVLEF